MAPQRCALMVQVEYRNWSWVKGMDAGIGVGVVMTGGDDVDATGGDDDDENEDSTSKTLSASSQFAPYHKIVSE
ncbi:hypothetical protein Tco_0217169 [Tanacetum coccineum]